MSYILDPGSPAAADIASGLEWLDDVGPMQTATNGPLASGDAPTYYEYWEFYEGTDLWFTLTQALAHYGYEWTNSVYEHGENGGWDAMQTFYLPADRHPEASILADIEELQPLSNPSQEERERERRERQQVATALRVAGILIGVGSYFVPGGKLVVRGIGWAAGAMGFSLGVAIDNPGMPGPGTGGSGGSGGSGANGGTSHQ